jgi:polyhydroxyalkanoate synthesis regulator phasin
VRDALKSYLALAGGVTEVTRQRALDAAKALVASGEAAAEQVTSLAEDLLTQTRQNREAVVALVGFEVDRALGRVGLASADEVTELTARVRALEARLAEQTGAGASAGAGGAAGRAATKAPTQQGGGGAAAKAPANRTAADKAPAKKAGGAAAGTARAGKAGSGAATAKAPAKKAPAKKAGA